MNGGAPKEGLSVFGSGRGEVLGAEGTGENASGSVVSGGGESGDEE